MEEVFLTIPILLFLFGGIALFALKRKAADALVLIVSGLSLLVDAYGSYKFLVSSKNIEKIVFYKNNVLGQVFGLTVDTASIVMSLLVTITGFLVFLYSAQYMEKSPEESNRKGYLYGWMSIALAASLFSIFSTSLIQTIIGLEVMAVSFSLLVNFYGINKGKGWKLFAVENLAVVLLLIALGYTGKSDLFLMNSLSSHEKILAFISMLFAAFAMSSQFFFYSWLPDSTQAPIPVSTLLHSVTLVSAGVIFFLRMVQLMKLPTEAFNLVWPFTVTMLVLMIIYYPIQSDAKKLIAYSTISQAAVSYTVISYGILGQQVGIQIGFYQMINHIVVKAIAFLSVGFFIYHLGTSDLRKIKGIRTTMPAASVAWFLSFLGLAGVLPLGLFFGKMFTIMSTMHGVGFTTWLIPSIILIDSGVFFVVVLYWFRDIFFGEIKLTEALAKDLAKPAGLMIAVVIVFLVIGSVMPWVSLDMVKRIVFLG
ncbi:MAG: hypothetical protein F7B59_05390 [Desulfurococcales archaeon]|nr:hypothetical protein [Desulfurococcales archaeon]